MCLMTEDRRHNDTDHNGQSCSAWRALVEQRFHDGTERMKRIEASLLENTASTKAVESNTSELVEGFANLKAAFKVLNWIGRAARPLGYIAAFGAAVVSLFVALKSGAPK